MQGERRPVVRLTPVEPGHAEAMSRWISDPEIAGALGVQREASLAETHRWIEQATSENGFVPLAILAEGDHVGNVVLDRIDSGTARLSIYIGEPEARGRGIGDAAVRLALERAFGELGLHEVWLTVHVGNGAAIATYERCGFEVEEVLKDEFLIGGERTDALRMRIFGEPYTPRP
jgi:RimJ/RimL family protein N-acetyltransferase